MTVNMPATDADGAAETIAAAFVAARRGALPLLEYPGRVPASLDDGYRIQDLAIALQGDAVAGWKVGRIWPPAAMVFGSNRLAGPIFAPAMVAAGGDTVMPVFVGGFGAVEAEFIYRLGIVDPADRQYSLAEAKACVTGVHYGIEIASSPLGAINDLGPAVTVSDFGNNHGLIVGPVIENWQDVDFDAWPIEVEIDGSTAGTGTAADFPDGSLGSVRFLLELLARRGIAVPQGTLVSTGAITGVHAIAAGQSSVVRFADRQSLSCRISKAEPTSK
ncbi:2-keto-4-pentenoate hydratase [Polymorphobacter glacialis]|uniref:2-keto-4-pentenoate hydratase n=1 Tax=Sandarakinorhabdus glacialis TaxID=1614636 RepID=A0A916ZZI3_9SPHN|nr:2-keto-4-pentenoate hydratase [Polymorphobacter glacialis]GGE19857.1 2-keto-4-pentenoate hydratase [Polymorphobacter glacialis]